MNSENGMAMRTKRCGAMIKAMNLVAIECPQKNPRLGKAMDTSKCGRFRKR